MSFGYSVRFYMIDTIAFVLAAVLSPLFGEAVCRWVAGHSKKEDMEEKAKLRRKKKQTKSRFSFMVSTLMVAAVLITWVNGPSSAKYAHS